MSSPCAQCLAFALKSFEPLGQIGMLTSKFVAPVQQGILTGLCSGDGLSEFRQLGFAFAQCCGDFFHYVAGFFTSLRFAFARRFDFGDLSIR